MFSMVVINLKVLKLEEITDFPVQQLDLKVISIIKFKKLFYRVVSDHFMPAIT